MNIFNYRVNPMEYQCKARFYFVRVYMRGLLTDMPEVAGVTWIEEMLFRGLIKFHMKYVVPRMDFPSIPFKILKPLNKYAKAKHELAEEGEIEPLDSNLIM